MEDPLRQAARLILASAYSAWHNSLVGDQAPVVRNYHERVKAPQIGDWVMETSSLFGIFTSKVLGDPLDQFGILLKREPYVRTDEETGEEVVTPGDYYWVIQTLDGREVRWGNADFIVIPDKPNFVSYQASQ